MTIILMSLVLQKLQTPFVIKSSFNFVAWARKVPKRWRMSSAASMKITVDLLRRLSSSMSFWLVLNSCVIHNKQNNDFLRVCQCSKTPSYRAMLLWFHVPRGTVPKAFMASICCFVVQWDQRKHFIMLKMLCSKHEIRCIKRITYDNYEFLLN